MTTYYLNAEFFLILVSKETITRLRLHIVEEPFGLVMSQEPTNDKVCLTEVYGIKFQRPCDGMLLGFENTPENTRLVKQKLCLPTGAMRRTASRRYGLEQLDAPTR